MESAKENSNNNPNKISEFQWELRNVQRLLNINGYDLTYKDPPFKGNIYRYRC